MDPLRILMFISATVDGQNTNHELTTRLVHAMNGKAHVDLKTTWHGIDNDALKSYHLIHVFGCWNIASIRLLSKAHRLHIPTVYSPMGGLQPWVIRKHRSSIQYRYQREAIRKASAVHVCSKLESDLFARLEWNSRSVLIKNPILTNLITFGQMSAAMLALYEKVLDTNARLLLDDHSRQAIGNLLELGVDKDVLFDHKHCQTMKANLALLTPIQWRRVMIYAFDEKIEDILKKGLERIQFVAPHIVIEQIDRFPGTRPYPEGELQGHELCYHQPSTLSKLDENLKASETNERTLCVQMLNLRHEVSRHAVPLRHLADIYVTLRFKDMDEDRLREIAAEMGLSDFAGRLMAVLGDVMRLSEGFMPFPVKDDRAARELAQAITKFNTWA